MKTVLICAALLAGAPAAAVAQTPSGAPKPTAGATVTEVNENTTIAAIAATPAGKAALEKNIPELLPHPAYDQFKGMTLRQLEPFSGGIITSEKIAAVEASLKGAK